MLKISQVYVLEYSSKTVSFTHMVTDMQTLWCLSKFCDFKENFFFMSGTSVQVFSIAEIIGPQDVTRFTTMTSENVFQPSLLQNVVQEACNNSEHKTQTVEERV